MVDWQNEASVSDESVPMKKFKKARSNNTMAAIYSSVLHGKMPVLSYR